MLTDVSVTVSACTPPASSGEKTRPGASATNRDRAARGSSGKRAGRRRQKTHHVCADAVDTLAADACVLEGRLVEGLLAPPRPAPPRPASRTSGKLHRQAADRVKPAWPGHTRLAPPTQQRTACHVRSGLRPRQRRATGPAHGGRASPALRVHTGGTGSRAGALRKVPVKPASALRGAVLLEALMYDLRPCCSIRAAAVLRSCHAPAHREAQLRCACGRAAADFHARPTRGSHGERQGENLGVADALDELEHLALVARERQPLRHRSHRQRHQNDWHPHPAQSPRQRRRRCDSGGGGARRQ